MGLINATNVFFVDGIMSEVACESSNNCDTDQVAFKAFLSRWMAATAKIAPWSYDSIMALLKTSATAAAEQCDGGTDGVTCGLKWTDNSTWDGNYGVGEQMAALEVVQGMLLDSAPALVTNFTGGTSQGNAAAGSGSASTVASLMTTTKMTTGGRVGAGVLTAVVLAALLGGVAFMVL